MNEEAEINTRLEYLYMYEMKALCSVKLGR